ncbi:MAG: 2-oxo acid dehydrogenase subunit E2 [Bacteroidales bacterium]|nr:2-oxo acid dehydrogenase subunit E2 [Bacteroidales bacterium]
MARFELIMSKLGESIIEATITKWLKVVGDSIEEDDVLVEIATDKVDSEIPSPVDGILKEVLFEEGETVPVGKVIAVIEMEGEETEDVRKAEKVEEVDSGAKRHPPQADLQSAVGNEEIPGVVAEIEATRFYSPLVKSIAKKENILLNELETVKGSGKDGRITKADILDYINNRPEFLQKGAATASPEVSKPGIPEAPPVSAGKGDEILEMDRMRRLIADHMVMSKRVSPHVTSFIEVDMTNVVKWRNKVKDEFMKRENEKITFTHIFFEAAAQTLKEFPGVNASVDGYKIILRKNINIGMATALPNGNLIVPVIKNADQKNLLGMAKTVNDLANGARNNKLNPDDIQGGTFTITNLGSFGSITGSPVINQPQVAILGIGVIKKKPVVLETPEGDVIAIRNMAILSLSYDHRAVDGAMGGMFLQRITEYIENFDVNRTI